MTTNPMTNPSVEEVARALLDKMDALEGELEGFFILATTMGIKWRAGSWQDERENLRNALALFASRSAPEQPVRDTYQLPEGRRDMASAPDDSRILIDFEGAGPIVAYHDPKYPAAWVRYLGFGKSLSWPTIHEDYALGWWPLPVSAAPKTEGA